MNKIAIMGAMREEIDPLLSYCTNIQEISFANNTYYKAKISNQDVVIAHSKIGKVFSTLTATIMIEKFGCSTLLFTGVAGAINPNYKIGDLIVATKLSQHDVDITAFGHPYGFIPDSSVFVNTDNNLISIAQDVASTNNQSLNKAIIATGDQFVANQDRKDFICNEFGADALEMEGASVALVCDTLNIPCLIIRTISDTADDDAVLNFDEFLKDSAKVSAEFIFNVVDEIANKQL